MRTREEALAYGLSFPNTYQDAPFHDENWQLVRVKGNKKVFLWGMYIKKMNIKNKVKDINDIIRLNIFDNEVYESCFSDDEFDVMFI